MNMTASMTGVDIKIAEIIQGDIPLVKRPYRSLGEDIGLDEKTMIETVQRLLKGGIIRKVGAVLKHRKAGFSRNAMVIWAVPDKETERAGRIFSSFKKVTHCYERTPAFEGKYNLFTMIHFRCEDMEKTVRKLALAAGVMDYRILESLEEFKKTSMKYF